MGSSWASANARQNVRITVTLKSDVTFSASEATEINDKVLEIVQNRSKASTEFDVEELYDGGLSEDGETVSADEEIEFVALASITVSGKYYYSPATMYDSHGDPGSPEEEDFEPTEGFIESIDRAAVLADLKKLPKLGEAIDESTFSAIVDDEFEIIEMIEDDYDPYDD